MLWFSKVSKDVYQRVDTLESEVRRIKTEQLDVLSQLEKIRNKVLRRFQGSDASLEPKESNTSLPEGFL